jgi:hypothetical protein
MTSAWSGSSGARLRQETNPDGIYYTKVKSRRLVAATARVGLRRRLVGASATSNSHRTRLPQRGQAESEAVAPEESDVMRRLAVDHQVGQDLPYDRAELEPVAGAPAADDHLRQAW